MLVASNPEITVRLFIDREEFSVESDASDPRIQRVEICIKIGLTEPYAGAPPPLADARLFVIDTGSDYSSVFLDDLIESGLPVRGPGGGQVRMILYDGSEVVRRRRDVTLWLYSNLRDAAPSPLRIDLSGGVIILPTPAPNIARLLKPVLGMKPLLDAGVRVDLDFGARRFSIWAPD